MSYVSYFTTLKPPNVAAFLLEVKLQRNMDLVRHILKTIEAADDPLSLDDFEYKDCSQEMLLYHLKLLQDQGFIDGVIATDDLGEYLRIRIDALTWSGQDFLSALSDQRVWKKVKDILAKSVGTTTFAVIKQTAELVAIQLIKKHL